MADFSALKAAIQAVIKQNGNQEITGPILQEVLLSMVNTMGDGAINSLASALSTETTNRQNADGTLQQGINSEANTRASADTTLQNNINSEANTRSSADTVLQNAINAIHTQIDNGYVYAGIATPSTSPATGKVFYIAVQAGTYTNFGSTIVTEGITILKFVGSVWVKEQLIYADGGVFDITAYNGGTTYADLSAALGNNGANIPEGIRKGGMSVKYVHTSDNKYVQYSLKTASFSIKEEDWAICNDEFYTQTSDWAYVLRDSVGQILAGIKYNGEVEWSLGVPTPVKNYVDNAVSQILNGNSGITIDGLNKVIAFLTTFSTSDTLKALLDAKKDKNDPLFNLVGESEISDMSEVTVDKDGKIIEKTDIFGNVSHYTNHVFKSIDFEEVGDKGKQIIVESSKISGEIEVSLENGTFNGGGGDVAGTTSIRTPQIPCDDSSLIIAICPETMNMVCNYELSYIARRNTDKVINAGISVSNPKNFVRFAYVRRDGTDLQLSNLTEEERNGIRIFKIRRAVTEPDYTVRIAAYNASNNSKNAADIVCTDTDAQFILNACLSCIGNINIKLSEGRFNLYKVFYDAFNRKCAIKTQDVTTNSQIDLLTKVTLKGSSAFFGECTRICMRQACFDLFDSENEGSMISVPCRNQDGISTSAINRTHINIEDIFISGWDYTKPIILLNLTFSAATQLRGLCIANNGYDNDSISLIPFRTMPNIGSVGIRVGHGSNDGVKNYVKNTVVFYCYKGVSCVGEHYIFEDVLTHHCYIGWAFGDVLTNRHFEHPNVMIGCSIEGCYRLMYLTKGGETTEGDFVRDTSANMIQSTLVCIGLSTEFTWSIPLDERVEGEPTEQRTLPILEVLKGAYRGRMELDYASAKPFETGSGKAFYWTVYYYSTTRIGHGDTQTEIIGE